MGKAIVAALEMPFPKGVQPLAILDFMGGGKSQMVEVSSAALASRPNYWFIFLCQWDPKETGASGRVFAKDWVRSIWTSVLQLAMDAETDGVILDTHGGDVKELLNDTLLMGQQAKVKNVWGENAPRMLQVKEQYDPENFFSSNISAS